MTVEQNVAFGLKQEKTPAAEIRQRVGDMLEMVRLGPYAKRKPHQLSGGQRQAVAVARAAAFGSKVVILDEPTAALGVKEGNAVLDMIMGLRDKGLPVILISHNMPHVWEVADRIHIQRLARRAGIITPQSHTMQEGVAIMTGAACWRADGSVVALGGGLARPGVRFSL